MNIIGQSNPPGEATGSMDGIKWRVMDWKPDYHVTFLGIEFILLVWEYIRVLDSYIDAHIWSLSIVCCMYSRAI